MRVLVFSPYYPPHIGGLETHSDEFNKHLASQGADITVFTPLLPASAPEIERLHHNITIIRFPAFEVVSNYPLPKFWLPTFWKIFFSLFQTRYDFIISRTRFFFSSFMALLYAKITRTKLVHIEHGSDFVKLSSYFKTLIAKIYDYTIGFLIFRCSDINISISHAVQKFVQKFDSRTSPIIYRGIDFSSIDVIRSDDAFKERFSGKIIIGVMARLYKWKGIEHSIRAIQDLPEDIQSKVVFVVLGQGEDFDHLQKIASDPDTVHLLGNFPREKALAMLKTFDIYIHSSFPGGGLSTSLLEAMYCHCAIVATPHEGANEVITHDKNGLLIDDPDSEKIRSALIKLIRDQKLRIRLSNQAKLDVQEKFSWSGSIECYQKVFDGLNPHV